MKTRLLRLGSMKTRLLLLACILLLGAGFFTLSSVGSRTTHAVTLPQPSAVTFANNNWNCLTAACTSTVKAGAAQPDYECAEFVARSLAYAGYMPGLGSTSSQSAYDPYNPHLGNGRVYDLLLITPTAGLHTLADYLLDSGFGMSIGHNLSEAVTGDVVVFEKSGGSWHTAIIAVKGSSTSTTLLDAHNNARYHYALSNYIGSFSGWYIIHVS